MRGRALLFSFSLLLACGDDDGGGTDAGARDAGGAMDAGEADAGGAVDGGGGDDAGLADGGAADARMDAGPDAGSTGSPGCVDGAGLEEGEHTFTPEDIERRYLLYLPTGYDGSRPWPLIFALHGNGGSVDYWDRTSGDRNIRGEVEDGAILVIAEAIDNAWRDYDMPRETWPPRIEQELRYFDHLKDELGEALCVDEDAIFSMGFSGGGSFSGVLGCRREYVRAIAVGGSVIYFEEEDCVSTPAAWITIGTEELTDGRAAYRDFFRDRAGCDAESSATDPDPCVAYAGCDPATPVHYCQHPGGHVWPDFGTEAAWAFFRRFVE